MTIGQPSLQEVLHRWDVVVAEWRLDAVERSMVLGLLADGAIDQIETYRAGDGEERMRLAVALAAILRLVHSHPHRTRIWLRRPNVHLGGRTPLERIANSPDWIKWLLDNGGIGS